MMPAARCRCSVLLPGTGSGGRSAGGIRATPGSAACPRMPPRPRNRRPGPADESAPVMKPVEVRGRAIPPDELSWRFSRSSGPGGQSVNTTDSRVELSYDLAASGALGPVLKARALRALSGRLTGGVITVTASEHRSQLRNREAAAARLSALLVTATAPSPTVRRPTRPSRAARERRLSAKRRRGEVKRLRRHDGD